MTFLASPTEVEENGVNVGGRGEAVAANVEVGDGHGGQPMARKLGKGSAEVCFMELEGEEALCGPNVRSMEVGEGGGAGACDKGQQEVRA